ncbi:germination protein GerYC [Paenibacillus baekrokdamisoli]|uniref:Germination protein GerYC n=1 Tax=Paenibacillus baekrokdamisoli TaxID=1712516 RepID=A0A3G9IYZ4_9BACL|nr:Ger(x)C family spore germination protein [Paenibacillus baekrokdamisoli]MBB3069185.1 Ger(x)C family germination protein [Paenibacillus baekrokdamisoli]BBH18841.1 germination protein GerYC [Paenibacillus baekrokdamisoli]
MIVRLLSIVIATSIVVLLVGCNDQLNMEDASIPLAIGVDLNKTNRFQIYSSTPIFSKDIKKKSHEITGTADSLRQSRTLQDAQSVGTVQGRNFQVLLIGKRMLQHENWFKMLDVLFRDARNTVTDRVIAVDGNVSEIIYLNPDDQPSLPLLLRGMVDSSSMVSETVKTTVHELHRQMYEKGMTPYISEVQVKNKKIILIGTTLLDHKGKYAASLGTEDSIFLNMLQKNAKPGVSISLKIPDVPKTGPFDTNYLSFTAGKISTKIKTSYVNNKFNFTIKIKTSVGLSEHFFPTDAPAQVKELEKQISAQMQKKLEKVIKMLQLHKIDPIGLGLYARAHEYQAYQKVEDHWGDALANANINVSVDIKIVTLGPVK